ncbi:STAM-binding protein-like A isoform X1 [Vespa velutina]|uniref:STAM-binding protein-like A isoform X1 n=1 Tax=Vespa velutina TaxID=202808 RepID=UPI001FB26728|nr:STAM-binding protein-like A isoform X1 [Vespa velutina]
MKRNKSESKHTGQYLYKEMGIKDPETRLKELSEKASKVTINHNIPPHRYYRSGIQMIRQADVYVKEKNYEEAYCLFLKFITLFVEKMQHHQMYHVVTAKDKAINKQKLREVIPKAEELKKQLLKQYQNQLDKDLEDTKKAEKANAERLKQEEEQRLKEEEERKNKLAALEAVKAAKIAASTFFVTTDDTRSIKLPIPNLKPPTSLPVASRAQSLKDNSIPTVDRSTKPTILLNDSGQLRDIVLPSKLIENFLALAFSNTANNKETCGILTGKLEQNKLLITHLLIPQQTGSPDSCLTLNEEDIFDFQDHHNLITLGWIHTHPTQTAFLSSVDLHTHCSYQLMMAEAIAIVCAPKYDETAFFILTPEYGLDYIANCRETGFHPHPTEPPLYMKAKHCKLNPNAPVEVIDLRRK